MGCGHSVISEELARDRRINKQLRRDFSRDAQIVKLLLLGAGESGKSTIVKQMKLLHPVNQRHEAGFSQQEKNEAKSAIFSNILESMVNILGAMSNLDITLDNNQQREARESVLTYAALVDKRKEQALSKHDFKKDEDPFVPDHCWIMEKPPAEICAAIVTLWKSPNVQKTYQRRNEFQLYDSASYFLNDLDRFTDDKYVPNDQDVLRTRVQTMGISKIEFQYKHLVFRMYDVGGQKNQRRKWIHVFDNVTCVLFVVAMSEYDQVLQEDHRVNRMDDSLVLFKQIVNNDYFSAKPFVVFFNKRDLFEEKVRTKSIRVAFPNYAGGLNDVKQSAEFIVDTFLSQNRTDPKKRPIYPHMTTATDTENVKYIFNSVADIILSEILKATGLN